MWRLERAVVLAVLVIVAALALLVRIRRFRDTEDQAWLAPHSGGSGTGDHVQHRDGPGQRSDRARNADELEAERDKPRELEAGHERSGPSGTVGQDDAAA